MVTHPAEIIVTHHNADFDALASLVAAQKLYPRAVIIMPDLQERAVREFLRFSSGSFSFLTERDIVPAKVRRLIVVDTRAASRIGRAAECLSPSGKEIIVFDHHPRRAGDLRGTEDVFAATGATVTILVERIRQRDVPLSPLEATVLCLGIYEDTGSLTFPTTTQRDVEAVSFLFSRGADLGMIGAGLTRELSEPESRVLASLMTRLRRYDIAGLAIGIVSVRPPDSRQDVGWIIHKLLEIENVQALFALVSQGKRMLLMARSRGPQAVAVNRIMKAFGGGGHISAAAAVVTHTSAKTVEQRLLREIRRRLRSPVCARDIMRPGTRSINVHHTMRQARQIMESLRIQALAVEDRHKITGLIARPAVEQALRQGYAHAPVKAYMAPLRFTVTPRSGIAEIRRIFMRHDVARVPVLRAGKPVGIIDRADVWQAQQRLSGARAPRRLRQPRQTRGQTLRLMKRVLSPRILSLLRLLGRQAQIRQEHVYAVGGFVRDLLLERSNLDIDLVVEGDGLGFARSVAALLKIPCTEYPRFKTAKMKLPQGMSIDIATARSEYYPHPAALPVVRPGTIQKDLGRRDFSINTMALCLNPRLFGRVLDFFNAQQDLRQGRIRVLHDLSFIEDPTRILRAVRFEQRFDFKIDPHTEYLIRAAVDMDMFKRLHTFRLAAELKLLWEEPHPLRNIRRMAELHELAFIHPAIRYTGQLAALLESAEEALGWYRLTFPGRILQRWLVYLLVLMDRVQEDERGRLFHHIGISPRARQCLTAGTRKVPGLLRRLRRARRPDAARFGELLREIPHEALLYAMAKLRTLEEKEIIITFLTKYDRITPGSAGRQPHPHRRPAGAQTIS